jgi:hypothetical protein
MTKRKAKGAKQRMAVPPPSISRVTLLRLHPDPDAPELAIEPGRLKRALALVQQKDAIAPFLNAWTYKVRSQRGGGFYHVEERSGLWDCDCPDAALTRPCLHVLGVFLKRGIIPHPDEETEEPEARDGKEMDHAAMRKAELAISSNLPRLAYRLFEMLPQPPPRYGPGRPSLTQTDGLLCALLWSINGRNMRREQETRDRLTAEGILGRRIACNSVSRALTDEETTPLLEAALRLTREPFSTLDAHASPLTLAVGSTFAVDSTGFTPSRRGHYSEERHRQRAAREKRTGPAEPLPWLKAHIMVSTRAHLITSARITSSIGKGTGDPSLFPPLMDETAATFRVGVVVGDPAYTNRAIVEQVVSLGATPIFKPRSNMRTQQHGVSGWGDMIAFFMVHRQEFDALYHRRVQVESVNSAIKRRFGESLRSRTPISRRNELLCRLIAYNLVVLIQQVHLLHAEDEWLERIL